MTTKTATLVKANLEGFNGTANLYRCDPPLQQHEPWDENEEQKSYEYVVASAANAMFSGPETYLFGADKDGEIVDWDELPGSFKGGLDHERALQNAGYTVA